MILGTFSFIPFHELFLSDDKKMYTFYAAIQQPICGVEYKKMSV